MFLRDLLNQCLFARVCVTLKVMKVAPEAFPDVQPAGPDHGALP